MKVCRGFVYLPVLILVVIAGLMIPLTHYVVSNQVSLPTIFRLDDTGTTAKIQKEKAEKEAKEETETKSTPRVLTGTGRDTPRTAAQERNDEAAEKSDNNEKSTPRVLTGTGRDTPRTAAQERNDEAAAAKESDIEDGDDSQHITIGDKRVFCFYGVVNGRCATAGDSGADSLSLAKEGCAGKAGKVSHGSVALGPSSKRYKCNNGRWQLCEGCLLTYGPDFMKDYYNDPKRFELNAPTDVMMDEYGDGVADEDEPELDEADKKVIANLCSGGNAVVTQGNNNYDCDKYGSEEAEGYKEGETVFFGGKEYIYRNGSLVPVTETGEEVDEKEALGLALLAWAEEKMSTCEPGNWDLYNRCEGESFKNSNARNVGNPNTNFWCTELIIEAAEAIGLPIESVNNVNANKMYQDFQDHNAVTKIDKNTDLKATLKPGQVVFVSNSDQPQRDASHVAIVKEVNLKKVVTESGQVKLSGEVVVVNANAKEVYSIYNYVNGKLQKKVGSDGSTVMEIVGAGSLVDYNSNET